MGLFSKLKAAVGIGGVGIDIEILKDEYTAGSEITGKIIVKGGSVEQIIEELHLEFTENWTELIEKEASVSSDESDFDNDPFFKDEEEKDEFEDDPFFKDEEETEEKDEFEDDPFFKDEEDEEDNEDSPTVSYKSIKHADMIIAQNIAVNENYSGSFDFSVTIPAEAQISTDKRKYQLYAWGQVPKAIDPTSKIIIKII